MFLLCANKKKKSLFKRKSHFNYKLCTAEPLSSVIFGAQRKIYTNEMNSLESYAEIYTFIDILGQK